MAGFRFLLPNLFVTTLLLASVSAHAIEYFPRGPGRGAYPRTNAQRLPDQIDHGPELEFLSKSEAAEQALNPRTLSELDEVAIKILAQFPPEDFDFLALGTSPSLLSEILRRRAELSGQDINLNTLPLSLADHIRSEDQFSNIRQHLETWLPHRQRRSSRPLVILDYVSAGKTLRNFASLLPDLKKNGLLDRPLRFAALIPTNTPAFRSDLKESLPRLSEGIVAAEDLEYFNLNRHLHTLFHLRAFKPFASFTSWAPPVTAQVYRTPERIPDDTTSQQGLETARVYNRRDMHTQLGQYFSGLNQSGVRESTCERILIRLQ